jgi:hypothetical protein
VPDALTVISDQNPGSKTATNTRPAREEEVRDGRLVILLDADEPDLLPVHLVMPDGRLGIAKIRAFVDFAAPRLKAIAAGDLRPSGSVAQGVRAALEPL